MLLTLHNLVRWLVLLLAVVAFARALQGIKGGVAYTSGARRAVSRFMMSVHVQLLLGIMVYGLSPLTRHAMGDMKAAMADKDIRFMVVEHPTFMLLGVIAATVTGVIARRGPDDTVRHRRAAIGVGIALVLILAGMPWQRPMVPGLQ
jgi:hypothetical protein